MQLPTVQGFSDGTIVYKDEIGEFVGRKSVRIYTLTTPLEHGITSTTVGQTTAPVGSHASTTNEVGKGNDFIADASGVWLIFTGEPSPNSQIRAAVAKDDFRTFDTDWTNMRMILPVVRRRAYALHTRILLNGDGISTLGLNARFQGPTSLFIEGEQYRLERDSLIPSDLVLFTTIAGMLDEEELQAKWIVNVKGTISFLEDGDFQFQVRQMAVGPDGVGIDMGSRMTLTDLHFSF